MAFVSQDRKKRIAALVKPVCKKYGIKATFGVHHHSSLEMNISEGKLDFIKNFKETVEQNTGKASEWVGNYMVINHYHYKNHFSGEVLAFLSEIIPLLNAENYDNSDISTDYFDVGYHLSINVGKWNKPYLIKE